MDDYANYKTIRQIAAEIGVSKQAVQKKISKEPLAETLKDLSTTINGAIYVDIVGIELIKSAFLKRQLKEVADNSSPTTVVEPPTTNNHLSAGVVGITADYINSLKEQIANLQTDKAILQEQLKEAKEYNKTQIADIQEKLEVEREHARQQAEKFADLSEKLAELTRNSQVLLKQEQDKSAFLLPEQVARNEKRSFWQFWKK